VRPTADRVRTAIFDLLVARYGVAGRRVLDLFAGSGALGLDALSRGAALAVFVDRSVSACRTIRENLRRSGYEDRARVLRLDLPRGLSRVAQLGPFGGVFVDPPYRRGLSTVVLSRMGEAGWLEQDAWVVAEHARGELLAERYGELRRVDRRAYGQTEVSIYRKGSEDRDETNESV
jgi:16S rRNA (guanine966-N2)-methyltransferase